MRKFLVFLCVAGLIAASASPLFAGGIDHKHNWSAEYIRTLNRNAATDSADAVAYNPAGVMKMENGLYASFSGQYAMKDYSNKNPFTGEKYSSDEPDFVPSLFGLYKKDKWAAYGAVTIVCGGGTVDYKDGDLTTFGLAQGIIALSPFDTLLDHRIEGESYFVGYTLGGAYAINDMVSVSLGVRLVDALRGFEGHATLGSAFPIPDTTFRVKYEETDQGWGGIIGANIAPTDKLNIGLRYETKTSLDLETDVDTDTVPGGIVTDGATRNRDLPALLGLGVSYRINPKIKLDANFTYYLNSSADWDDNPVTSGDETKKDNGYDIGIAGEYTFNPQWKASLGLMYTHVGIDPDNMSIEAPELDGPTIGAGVAYKPIPELEFNLGVLKVFYEDDETSSGVKFEKKGVVNIAVGIQYKFF